MGGSGSRGTLESQKHLLLAAKETEAGEVIKLPRVRQLASRLSSQTEIQVSGLLSSSPVEKGPLWKQPVRPPKRSSSFAGMMGDFAAQRVVWVSLLDPPVSPASSGGQVRVQAPLDLGNPKQESASSNWDAQGSASCILISKMLPVHPALSDLTEDPATAPLCFV